MSVDAAKLRADFPEFGDPARYPEAVLTFWLAVGPKLVNADRWGDLTDLGVELFAAHQLTLERKAMDAAAKGQVPGQSVGPVNNASVDKVTVGYDTAGGAEEGAGHWNLSTYGTRFISLSKLHGAGPMMVNACGGGSAGAWAGPWQSLFPNPSG